MRAVTETLRVKGEPDRELRLLFSRHGPVVHVDADRRRAYAFRCVWQLPGTAAYMTSLRYLDADSVDEYLQALTHWGTPTTNHVVADVDGNIAWQAAGVVPIRPTWDGLLPVPGDGRHEWAGLTDARDLPRRVNPPGDWVGSSNQMNLPADYDVAGRKTGFEFPDPGRYARLAESMSSGSRWTLADNMALQADVTSVPARSLCTVLMSMPWRDRLAEMSRAGIVVDPSVIEQARALLAGWNHRLEPGSAAAALHETWFSRHLMPGVMRALGPEGSRR
jgi:penicillin amidase